MQAGWESFKGGGKKGGVSEGRKLLLIPLRSKFGDCSYVKDLKKRNNKKGEDEKKKRNSHLWNPTQNYSAPMRFKQRKGLESIKQRGSAPPLAGVAKTTRKKT